jgi:hypothetical protein
VQNNIIFRSKKQTILRSAAFSFVFNAEKTIGAFYFFFRFYIFVGSLRTLHVLFCFSREKRGSNVNRQDSVGREKF